MYKVQGCLESTSSDKVFVYSQRMSKGFQKILLWFLKILRQLVENSFSDILLIGDNLYCM